MLLVHLVSFLHNVQALILLLLLPDGKQRSGGLPGRGLTIAALMVMGLAIIGLFIVIIVVMNRQTTRTDDLLASVNDMAAQLDYQTKIYQQQVSRIKVLQAIIATYFGKMIGLVFYYKIGLNFSFW